MQAAWLKMDPESDKFRQPRLTLKLNNTENFIFLRIFFFEKALIFNETRVAAENSECN